MYKGNNIMNLNQACLIEAVQMYLDSKFKEGMSPQVLSVKACGSGQYDREDTFEIKLTDSKPPD